MKKIPLAESIRLKQSLLEEFDNDIVMLGFTFHFLSKQRANLEKLSTHLTASEFQFVRIVDVEDRENFMLEVTKSKDGDISYLLEMETILMKLCFVYLGVSYLGATPIAERIGRREAIQQ